MEPAVVYSSLIKPKLIYVISREGRRGVLDIKRFVLNRGRTTVSSHRDDECGLREAMFVKRTDVGNDV